MTRRTRARLLGGLAALCAILGLSGARGSRTAPAELAAANAALIDLVAKTHGLSPAQKERLTQIFAGSSMIGQGNPAVTVHPMTPEQCRAREAAAGVSFDNPDFERICGGPYMAPLYDPATEGPDDAMACIDQMEFPDIPCTYPVVWTKAAEAAEICEAMGKRICDAHEWEGACAGALLPPDYRFDLTRGLPALVAANRMRAAHNALYRTAASHTWSYGPAYKQGICGANSTKTAGCNGGDWAGCGSNTYPTAAFPDCHSPLGVYDLNGNAAEHMNLPLTPDQMASTGSSVLGVTEMKGSWFIFDKYRAHEDWCRWRAPFWHGTRVEDPESHRNYHLGFRCCKTLESAGEAEP